MNNQEAFNKAVLGVVAQGGPSLVANHSGFISQCAYRAEDGRKCAVGHLIEDEDYDPFIEKKSVSHLYLRGYIPKLMDVSVELLIKLQDAHDYLLTDEHLGEFIVNAKDIASEYNLTFPEAEVKALLDLSKEVELA